MGKLYIILIILSFATTSIIGQAVELKSLDQGGNPKIELQYKVDNFAISTNDFLNKKISSDRFNQFMMNDQDIQYWGEQFTITKDVSSEDIHHKLKSLANEAKVNLTAALKAADRIEISQSELSFGKDPRLKVSKAANLMVHFIKNNNVVNAMKLTLIDVKGELKLIKAK